MTPFQKIEDSLVILYNKGRYTQSCLYRRNEKVYAKLGSSYIRLFTHGGTSVPAVIWKEYDLGECIEVESPHYITLKTNSKAIPKAA